MSRRTSTPLIIGLVVILIGVLLLLNTVGNVRTGFLLEWIPSLFILLGLWIMIKNRFRHIGGPILMIIVAGIIQTMMIGVDLSRYWPVILIVVGAAILIKGFRSGRGRRDDASPSDYQDSTSSVRVIGSERKVAPTEQDSINLVSVMGSVTQKIVSPEFKGGRATVVMAEANIDLREASVQEKPAVLEFSVVMGELKLRGPEDWYIRLDDDTVIGEIKDERVPLDSGETQPDLVVRGSLVMGSLKIED